MEDDFQIRGIDYLFHVSGTYYLFYKNKPYFTNKIKMIQLIVMPIVNLSGAYIALVDLTNTHVNDRNKIIHFDNSSELNPLKLLPAARLYEEEVMKFEPW